MSGNEQTDTRFKLVEVKVTDENSALNLLVQFLNMAQRKGCFSIDESAKIYECVSMFQRPTTDKKS